MLKTELQNFYSQDSKDYILERNHEFLNWFKRTISKGYISYIGIDELQKLIDYIVNWYEIKYPERELERLEGIKDDDFDEVKSIADKMDINQLLFRLSRRQISLMECNYRANNGFQYADSKNDSALWNSRVSVRIYKKDKNEYLGEQFSIIINPKTGEFDSKNYDLGKYLADKNIAKLDDLLIFLREKYYEQLDLIELEECIYNHNNDMKLRHKILELAAIKMVYSKNTTPEKGYMRAKIFINELNKILGLNLSTNSIDEIMHRNYSTEYVAKSIK